MAIAPSNGPNDRTIRARSGFGNSGFTATGWFNWVLAMHNDYSIVIRARTSTIGRQKTGRLTLALLVAVFISFALTIAVPPAAVGATPVPVPVATAPPLTPQMYLAQALDFIEARALRRSKVDWPTIRSGAEQRGAVAQTIAETHPIISDALKQLGDSHSSFRPPAKAAEVTQGQANGYGFLASWPARIVVSLSDGGPAATAGLKLRDEIVLIEGRKPTGVRQVVAFPSKTKVPDQLRLVVLRRSATTGPTAKAKRLAITIRKGNVSLVNTPKQDPAITKAVGDRFGYIDLPGLLGTEADQQSYAQSAHDAIRITERTPRCGWIVDVRRNRGGWVYPILAATAPLLGAGPETVMMGKVDAVPVTETWSYRNGEVLVNRPGTNPPDYSVFTVANAYAVTHPIAVAVLTSGLTASAGEAVVLSYRGKAATRSFGQTTLGLTTFDVVGSLPDGALLLVSNAAMTDQSFAPQEGPIQPDVAIAPDWNHVGDALDPILNAAIQWLNQQDACRT
jgi:carboxyl-terminal processing protease